MLAFGSQPYHESVFIFLTLLVRKTKVDKLRHDHSPIDLLQQVAKFEAKVLPSKILAIKYVNELSRL